MAYFDNNLPVAVAYAFPGRQVIHGRAFPLDHVCVQILATQSEGLNAPWQVNAMDENLFVKKGCFYAVPKNQLRLNKLVNGKLIYVPIDNL